MEIRVFTVRNKKTGELIHAEGVKNDEAYAGFNLDEKWFTEKDIKSFSQSWYKRGDKYRFQEELRWLLRDSFDLINFQLEKTDYQ